MTIPAMPARGADWIPYQTEFDEVLRNEARIIYAAQPSGPFRQATGRTNASSTPTLEQIYYYPIEMHIGFNYTRIGIRVAAACSVAGATAQLGIYDKNADGSIGDMVVDAGTVPTDQFTGTKLATINFTPTQNQYYAAVLFKSAVTGLTVTSMTNNASSTTGLYSEAGENQGAPVSQTGITSLPVTPTISTYIGHPHPVIFYGVS